MGLKSYRYLFFILALLLAVTSAQPLLAQKGMNPPAAPAGPILEDWAQDQRLEQLSPEERDYAMGEARAAHEDCMETFGIYSLNDCGCYAGNILQTRLDQGFHRSEPNSKVQFTFDPLPFTVREPQAKCFAPGPFAERARKSIEDLLDPTASERGATIDCATRAVVARMEAQFNPNPRAIGQWTSDAVVECRRP